jgi:hypothetical protein
MTDNNGWPGKPGVPPNPDWTGAHHWLSYQGEEPGLYEWDGKYWKMGGGHAPMDYVVDHFTYIAPVLTPAEADARVAQARRDALEEAAQAPREIAMGHGLVDVCVCNHEGRYGLVLKPRTQYVPIGEETAPQGSMVTLDGGCVVVWLDGPEFGKTIIEAIQEAAAIRALGKEGND